MSAKGGVKQVRKRFNGLVAALERVLEAVDGGAGGGQASLRPLRAALGAVDRAIRRLEESASRGPAGQQRLLELETGFDALWDELGTIGVWPVSEPSSSPAGRSLQKDVEGPADRLKEALERFSQEEGMAIGPSSEPAIKLLEALRKLDKRAAKGLSLQELRYWCTRFPEVRWDDPREARRVAGVVLLARFPGQVWEVRRRSTAPGRPLLLVIQSLFFPDEESLDACDQVCGRQSSYYVAATRPRWRIAWRFRPEAG